MELGTILGGIGAAVSILTVIAGWITLRNTTRSSFTEELRKEIDFLRAKIVDLAERHKLCEMQISNLKDENRILMSAVLTGKVIANLKDG